ncbi:MAG: PorP/SprF family type IX secretion system membrane protein [Bacteroidia bacterium]|nr:PorP/SprF family type IX secretion system membrane protein [Bacteroidia bacterium]
MAKRTILTLLVVVGVHAVSLAQQLPLFTRQLFQPELYNPGRLGADWQYTIIGGVRRQWMGFEGAPQNLYFMGGSRIGVTPFTVGALVYQDKAGLLQSTRGSLQMSVQLLPDNGPSRLGVGAYIGMIQQKVSPSETPDPLVPSSGFNATKLDAGLGLHYQYQTDNLRFQGGVSFVQLPGALTYDGADTTLLFRLLNHRMINLGVAFKAADQIWIEPLLIYRQYGTGTYPQKSNQLEAAVRVSIGDNLWVAGLLRSDGSGFGGALGLTLGKKDQPGLNVIGSYESQAGLGNILETSVAFAKPIAATDGTIKEPKLPKPPKQNPVEEPDDNPPVKPAPVVIQYRSQPQLSERATALGLKSFDKVTCVNYGPTQTVITYTQKDNPNSVNPVNDDMSKLLNEIKQVVAAAQADKRTVDTLRLVFRSGYDLESLKEPSGIKQESVPVQVPYRLNQTRYLGEFATGKSLNGYELAALKLYKLQQALRQQLAGTNTKIELVVLTDQPLSDDLIDIYIRLKAQ